MHAIYSASALVAVSSCKWDDMPWDRRGVDWMGESEKERKRERERERERQRERERE